MTKKLGYIPALDGLRAFAIALVMLAHANFQLFENGGVGVPVFFVLSGFLITTLLLEEYEKNRSISFKAFYIRRTFRLFPALYSMLFFTLIYGFAFNADMFEQIYSEIIVASLYVYNISWIWEVEHLMLYHTWSLAIEEQFYLMWPATLYLFLKYNSLNKATLLLVALVLFFGSNVFFNLIQKNQIIFIIRAVFNESIFIGCLLAILRWKRMFEFKIPTLIAFTSVLIIFIIGILPHHRLGGIKPNSIASIFTFIIVLHFIQNPSGLLSQIFSNKIMVFIGKISYGLYLWHLPIFKVFAFHSTLPPIISFVSKFIISFLFAIASWYFLEKIATRVGHTLSTKILAN